MLPAFDDQMRIAFEVQFVRHHVDVASKRLSETPDALEPVAQVRALMQERHARVVQMVNKAKDRSTSAARPESGKSVAKGMFAVLRRRLAQRQASRK